MASNKSQLDVYKIDTHTVINDILSNLTDIENEQFKEQIKECAKSKDVLSDAVLSCIHRIIDHIMKMHNDKKNTLHYIKKDLSDPIIDGYAMVLYEGESKPTSPIYVLLGDRVSRTRANGISYSHVLFVYNKEKGISKNPCTKTGKYDII